MSTSFTTCPICSQNVPTAIADSHVNAHFTGNGNNESDRIKKPRKTASSPSSHFIPPLPKPPPKMQSIRNVVMQPESAQQHTVVEIDDDDDKDSVIDLEPKRYHMLNIQNVLETVLSAEMMRKLFSDDEVTYLRGMFGSGLSRDAQDLLARLVGRKGPYFKTRTLIYDDIQGDVNKLCDELVMHNYMVECNDITLIELMDNVNVDDLKPIAKLYGVSVTKTTKANMISALNAKAQAKTKMFGSVSSLEPAIRSKITAACGRLIKFSSLLMLLLERVAQLYSMSSHKATFRSLLSNLFLSNTGKLKYPEYTINIKYDMYPSRCLLDTYIDALECRELEVTSDVLTSTWTLLSSLCPGAWNLPTDINYWELCSSDDLISLVPVERVDDDDVELAVGSKLESLLMIGADVLMARYRPSDLESGLPDFLEPYRPSYVYTSVLYHALPVLERLHQYKTCVALAMFLLSLKFDGVNYERRWNILEHLSIDLKHVGCTLQSFIVCGASLMTSVSPSCFSSLLRRLQKLAPKAIGGAVRIADGYFTSKISDPDGLYADMVSMAPNNTNEIISESLWHVNHITGYIRFARTGYKNAYSLDGTQYHTVEDIALRHYTTSGYSGMFSEGQLLFNMYNMIMKDIIFMDVMDVFQTPFQNVPLDHGLLSFYDRRRDAIECKIKSISTSTIDDLIKIVQDAHSDDDKTKTKVGDTSAEIEFIKCLGNVRCSRIFHWISRGVVERSGFPDLVLWKAPSDVLVVEVKGPNDRLSDKQSVWLRVLTKCSINVEICRVDDGTER